MLPELCQKATLFYLLFQIDQDLAEKARAARCPYCGGPLHYANYPRKPRGVSQDLSDECLIRFSLCCGRENCRHRVIPPSCRFNGARVYWHGVMLVVMTLRQGRSAGKTAKKFQKLFSITRNTVARWIGWYRDEFPYSVTWHRVRGLVCPTVNNGNLPADLLKYCIDHCSCPEQGLVSCLKLLCGG